MNPLNIVTIEKQFQIFKEGNPASAIEVVHIKDKENNSIEFDIIAGKNLYNIGDTAVYIMPDYCIPPIELFKEYYAPGGDIKKSKLGKGGRIRAVKFNFNFENSSNPIYSNGILIPLAAVKTFFETYVVLDENSNRVNFIEDEEYLQTHLHIIKYVAEDSHEKGNGQNSGATKGDIPYFLYKTDETRIETLKKHVNKIYEENEPISLTVKRDGSSCTIYCKKENEEFIGGICSRSQEKKIGQKMAISYIDNGIHLEKYFNKDLMISGWKNAFTDKFYTNEEVIELGFESIEKEIRDSWVDTCVDNGYFEKFIEYCKKYNVELALRGELIGAGNKGSGNKLNIDANGQSHVVWFGIDDLCSGHATRINYLQEHNLIKVCEELELEYTKEIHTGIMTYTDIIDWCTVYFNKIKTENNQIIEGIVIRTKNTNGMSCKYINPEYDSKS
jgi:hypothetical protein